MEKKSQTKVVAKVVKKDVVQTTDNELINLKRQIEGLEKLYKKQKEEVERANEQENEIQQELFKVDKKLEKERKRNLFILSSIKILYDMMYAEVNNEEVSE